MILKTTMSFLLVALLALPVLATGESIPAKKTGGFSSALSLTGGDGAGFVLRQVRWGDQQSFERVVFEFARPPGGRGVFPRVSVSTEESPLRLYVEASGSARSEERLFASSNPFAKSRLLSGVQVYDLCGFGQGAAVVPARPVEYEVFTLQEPPRLVVDLRLAAAPPAERERFSIRTGALMGDQACVFFEEARALGLAPRLLTDSIGQTFGEVALHDTAEEAFRAKNALGALASRFSLTVKRVGVME